MTFSAPNSLLKPLTIYIKVINQKQNFWGVDALCRRVSVSGVKIHL